MLKQFIQQILLLEQVTTQELKQLASKAAELISQRFDLERVLLMRDVLTSPQTTELDVTAETPLAPAGQIFKQGPVIANYKIFFGDDPEQYSHSEILKFEFSGYNWLYINLAFTEGGEKFATMSFAPDMHDRKLISQLGGMLKGMGYQLFSKPGQGPGEDRTEHNETFMDRLVTIFRQASGRHFYPGMFRTMKPELDLLIQEEPEKWQEWRRWVAKQYGGSVTVYRLLALPKSFQVETVNGEQKAIEDLEEGEQFYYSPAGRPFSQWSESNNVRDIEPGATAGWHGGAYLIKADIPSEKIVYSNKVLPAGFAPHNLEQEMIVSHPDANAPDKQIKATIFRTA